MNRAVKVFARVAAVLLPGMMETAAASTTAPQQTGRPAALNYRLHCEGCHQADGSGQPGYVPTLQGVVSTFLAVPEGREYLVRVPGMAQSLLNDQEAADVLNWMVRTFDPAHLPAHFVPYTAKEVAQLRHSPISQSSVERARVVALVEAKQPASSASQEHASAVISVQPPPHPFAICGACHPVSAGGENAIGPNLRGIVGRRAAADRSFEYSKAMRDSGIVWTRAELEQFLRDPPAKVPGTLMNFTGFTDVRDRQAVLDYLETLR